jgi:hypothetical protein
MTRPRRWLAYTALVAVALVGGLVLGIDGLARRAVERGAEQATGVDASVTLVHIGITRPSFSLRGLSLANPEGFRAEQFLALRSAHMPLPTRNLLAHEIRVPELVVEGLELELQRERGGERSNYGEILDNLARGAKAQPAQEGGRTLMIERVVVRDARAKLLAAPLPPLDVKLPELVLRNVGGSGSGAENVEIVVRAVLVSVLGALARDTAGVPREVARELASGLRDIAVQRSVESVEELGRSVGKTAREAAEGLGRLFRREER